MPDQTIRKSDGFRDKAGKPSAMKQVELELYRAKKISDISGAINVLNTHRSYQIVHIGICSLDDVPLKETLHSCTIRGMGVSLDDLDEEIRWSICRESEYLLRPFNLLTHEFQTVDSFKFESIRKIGTDVGVKQVMVVPMKVKNTTTVVTTNFPLGDFEDHASMFLLEVFQIISTIFEMFPKLLSWPKGGKLTPREVEILSLSATGLTEAVIAKQCGISVNTVRNHVENCKVKLNARNKLHAVMIAAETHEIDKVLVP